MRQTSSVIRLVVLTRDETSPALVSWRLWGLNVTIHYRGNRAACAYQTEMKTCSYRQFERDIFRAMLSDRHRLRKQLRNVKRSQQQGKSRENGLRQLRQALERSIKLRQQRQRQCPSLTFDTTLPIHAKRQEIADAIHRCPVIVVCGETGSGKSTQLPKICLEIGRGVEGYVGHTQPRRIAARSVAARLAEELGSPVGQAVGYKIRFADTVRAESYVKLMTDGILLAETQHDPFLEHYDTLIVDEAHERSLNIDFLLGYLHRLLQRRRDLRLIITSATIDAARFAEHFSTGGQPAPVIEVSGRTYPVETRYQPLESDDDDQEGDLLNSLATAVNQLCREGPGDILIFLPTEREIRDTAKVLRGWSQHQRQPTEILPLYARLPLSEQQRIFRTGKRRRIVLATNVAESSLTVPGIRYVIDTGTARISRYSSRSKVQRLPIEPISQASADQRQGRCGRIGPGICIRLYSEDDYLSRDRYTTPEIRRTNLAGVILQMLALRLGDVDSFPFLEPPRSEAIRDGYKSLFELGAIDRHRRLTEVGRAMSRLPVDPRIARMILASQEGGCLADVLIIAAAIEIQDPRERPPEKEKLADQCHLQFQHDRSDFMAYLELWKFVHNLKSTLSRNRFRKACSQNFLSFNRLREWQDVHRQLKQLIQESGLPTTRSEAKPEKGTKPRQPQRIGRSGRTRQKKGSRFQTRPNKEKCPQDIQYDAVHRALLTGLLSNIALRGDRHEYQTGGSSKAFLWPGSGVFSKNPRWVVAAEAVETHRRYLRTVASIDPNWIEPLAEHLVKRSHSDPHWSRKRSTSLVTERVTLFGLPIVSARRVPFGTIDPEAARRLFIQCALVEGDFDSDIDFYVHNRELIEELHDLGAKSRRADYFIADGAQFEFYHERLPDEVHDARTLAKWLRKARAQDLAALKMTVDEFVPQAEESPGEGFPEQLQTGELTLEVSYRFQPGTEDDGVSVNVPRPALRQVGNERLDWLVPGLLEEKLVALIRCLPKSIRRNLVPAADSARRAAELLEFGKGPFLPAVAVVLSRLAEEPISVESFQLERLPPYLRVYVRVLDDEGRVLVQGRDVDQLRSELGVEHSAVESVVDDARWQRDGITSWDFGELPERVELQRGGLSMYAFPTLVDRNDSVSLRLMDSRDTSQTATRAGMRRLFVFAEQQELKSQVHWLPQLNQIELWASTLGHRRDLRSQLGELLADRAYCEVPRLPRDATGFAGACRSGRKQLLIVVQDVAKLIVPLFAAYHQARLAVDEVTAPSWRDAVTNMNQELAILMADGFLVEAPWTWLVHYPRYLKAIVARLDRLENSGPAKDREAMSLIEPLWDAYTRRRDEQLERGHFDPELVEYRWMLAEFRVSLFAQKLGTAVKVSPQRLEKQWSKVSP